MHHARLIVGTYPDSLSVLAADERTASTDVSVDQYDTFGITEARRLKDAAAQAPVVRDTRVFVIACSTITTEAQNALLKLFEDPPRTAQFCLIIEQESMVLPTLRSRLMRVEGVRETPTEAAETLLRMPVAEQLAEIASRQKKKDIQWFDAVFAGIEQYVGVYGDDAHKRAVLFVRNYDRARSASKKMLLEHLVLSLSDLPEMR